MKLKIVSYNNLAHVKGQLESYAETFKENSCDQLEKELGTTLFTDTNIEVPDFPLDTSAEKPHETDIENVMRVYGNMQKAISPSAASDERLWAGLCLGTYWNYVKYRWNISDNCTPENINEHFFFAKNARRSLTRNALARLWWIGKLTYDDRREDCWELTEFVCRNTDFLVNTLERSFSNNINIVRPFLEAVINAEANGIVIDRELFRNLAKYLNTLGGLYILDCVSEETIREKIFRKAVALSEQTRER